MEGLLWVYQNKHDIVPIHDKWVNEPNQKHTLYRWWHDNDDNNNDADDNDDEYDDDNDDDSKDDDDNNDEDEDMITTIDDNDHYTDYEYAYHKCQH